MLDNQSSSKESLLARYILQTNATIRQTAVQFDMSKSSVHSYVSNRLKKSNYPLYSQLKLVLDKHFEEKHLHGGEATRQKYLNEKTRCP